MLKNLVGFQHAHEEVAAIQLEFSRTRDFFDAVREASRDADRVKRQLDAMAERELSLGGSSFEPRVRTSPNPGRMEGRVVAKVDLEERLRDRQRDDYDMLDLACAVLYGTDAASGLWAFVGWPADAICQHYVNDLPWSVVAKLMGYEKRYVVSRVRNAMRVCDEKVDFEKVRATWESTRKDT